MAYLSSLLRQSGARVSSRAGTAALGGRAPSGLEVDDVRVVAPTPAGVETVAPVRERPPDAQPSAGAAPVAGESPRLERLGAREERPEVPLGERSVPPGIEVIDVVVEPVSVPVASAAAPSESTPQPRALAVAAPPRASTKPREAESPVAPAEAPPEQVVLERVAEVVAWVTASPPAEEPYALPARAFDSTSLLPAAPAPRLARHVAPAPGEQHGPEMQALSVSVGTIEVTVEEPAPAALPAPASPARALPSAADDASSRLSRHYLRI